jgi:transcriptional regulator with XRE-family HTH domain
LKERLHGLRKDRGLTLADVENGTGIPKLTLQRLEVDSHDMNAHQTRVGYQDIVALAKFYDVSADYLCGLTENLRYSNEAIDRLHLSDDAVAVLIDGKLNTRLLSELITQPEFIGVMEALEVLIDGRLSENMRVINQAYGAASQMINTQTAAKTADEYIATLNELHVDGDDYIRFKITRRFDSIIQSLCETHKKEVEASGTAKGYIQTMMEMVQKYRTVKEETGSRARKISAERSDGFAKRNA